jgi:hypothetical protein
MFVPAQPLSSNFAGELNIANLGLRTERRCHCEVLKGAAVGQRACRIALCAGSKLRFQRSEERREIGDIR